MVFNPTPRAPKTSRGKGRREEVRFPVALLRSVNPFMAARHGAGNITAASLARGTEVPNSMPWREIRCLPTGGVLPQRAALFAVHTLTSTLSAIVV